MGPVAATSIVITFVIIFLLNRAGKERGLHVNVVGGVAIAFVVCFLVWLGFTLRKKRDLESEHITKVMPLVEALGGWTPPPPPQQAGRGSIPQRQADIPIPLEHAKHDLLYLERVYTLCGLPDTVLSNILGLAESDVDMQERMLQSDLETIYWRIEPKELIRWAADKIRHLKRHSAGPAVESVTFRSGLSHDQELLLRQLLDVHGIPRQIALLDLVMDVYVEHQSERWKAAREKENIEKEFKRDIAAIKKELSGVDLKAEPWDRFSLKENLE
jgi:hypothetical protein